MTTKDVIDQAEKYFNDKFLGKCPDFHDPNTHQNYPSEWKEKMINIPELKLFLSSYTKDLLQSVVEMTNKKAKLNDTSVKAMAYNQALSDIITNLKS